MKMKTAVKILMMAGLLVFLGLTEAMASSTLVMFTVPVRISPAALGSNTNVACNIIARDRRRGTVVGAGHVNQIRGRTSVNVTVRPTSGKSFQKGDRWMCWLNYPSGSRDNINAVADTTRSTLRVSGTL